MSLRHALLALFTARPMTGYDLNKQFLGSTDYVWHAADSQVYPELRRMEAAGLISGEQLPSGSSGDKTLYTITEDGVAEFRRWMNEVLPYGKVRDQYHLKAAYFEWAEPDAARAQLRAHMEHHSAQIERWQQLIGSLSADPGSPVGQRLARAPTGEHARIIAYKRYAYEGMIARSQAELEWAASGLRLIDEHAPAARPESHWR